MSISESARMGKRGTLVIPAPLRTRFGLREGSQVLVEDTSDGILIRPAVTLPIEIYSQERQAEFLLNNAIDTDEYLQARAEVESMGLDPDRIDHSSQ